MGDAVYDGQAKTAFINSDSNSENRQSCMTRKRWIILGIAVAILIGLVVIAVVVVVVNQNNDKDSNYSPECGPFNIPEDASWSNPKLISARKTCPLKGDCWSGEKCLQCFKLKHYKVGNINNIPVCCPNCIISGFEIYSDECNCRYN